MDSQTQNAINEGIQLAKDFLQKLISPSVEEMGLLVADNIRFWRFKNQIRMLQKAESYVVKKQIEVKRLPIKILVPLLEGASLEENDELQEKWVGLLVNYIDSKKVQQSSIFPFILSQLSTNEAKCLEFLRYNAKFYTEFHEIPKELEIFDSSLSNLIRLGLIRQAPYKIIIGKPYHDHEGSYIQKADYDDNDLKYEVTELGYEFVAACKLDDYGSK